MNQAALHDTLLRILVQRPVIADTMEEGLDILLRRIGHDIPRATLAAAVQATVAESLVHDPVRLPPGALQCHWHLELTPRGREVASQGRPATSGTD